jgi:hypothetical protein
LFLGLDKNVRRAGARAAIRMGANDSPRFSNSLKCIRKPTYGSTAKVVAEANKGLRTLPIVVTITCSESVSVDVLRVVCSREASMQQTRLTYFKGGLWHQV